jgi:hypothetical protein
MELMLSVIESDLREHPSLFVLLVVKALNKNELATSNRWENPAKRELPEEGGSLYSWKRQSECFLRTEPPGMHRHDCHRLTQKRCESV